MSRCLPPSRGTWRFVFLVCAAALTVGLLGLHRAQGDAHGEGNAKVSLHDEMSQMNRAMRRLRRQIQDPTRQQDALASVVALQHHALACKGLTPDTVDELPDHEQAAALMDYRTRMIQVVQTLLRLERQLLDGDYDHAQESYDQLGSLQDQGHKRFRKKDH